jgi:hypothetical protein
MRPYSILLAPLFLVLLFACSKPPEATSPQPPVEAQKEDQYRRELDEIRKTIKGEVKIKLKKDGKGEFYSWEISGKDANEVLKVNDTLTKKLGK